MFDPISIGEEIQQRFGYRLNSFTGWPIKKALKSIATAGYQSVELSMHHPDIDPDTVIDSEGTEIRKMLEANKLRISSLSCHPVENNIDTFYQNCFRGIEMAPHIGADVFILGCIPETLDPGGRVTQDAIWRLLQLADQKGLTIAVETGPDTVFHGFYDFSMLVSQLASLPLGLNLNVVHAVLTEGDIGAVIHEFAPYIVHTNIADCRKNDHQHLAPGEGHLDIRSVLVSLVRHHYKGDFTIDPNGETDAPDKLAAETMERCRELTA